MWPHVFVACVANVSVGFHRRELLSSFLLFPNFLLEHKFLKEELELEITEDIEFQRTHRIGKKKTGETGFC